MTDNIIKNVQTQSIGFAPILKSYFEKCAIEHIIDDNNGVMPNRKDVRNPRSEYLLKGFEDVVSGCLPLADGQTYCFISELTPLQREILSILEVPFSVREPCFARWAKAA